MKFKILNVTDLKGIPKDNDVWGQTMAVPVLELEHPMFMFYLADSNKFRRTSLVKGIESCLDGHKKIYTMNSVYELEEVGV